MSITPDEKSRIKTRVRSLGPYMPTVTEEEKLPEFLAEIKQEIGCSDSAALQIYHDDFGSPQFRESQRGHVSDFDRVKPTLYEWDV